MDTDLMKERGGSNSSVDGKLNDKGLMKGEPVGSGD